MFYFKLRMIFRTPVSTPKKAICPNAPSKERRYVSASKSTIQPRKLEKEYSLIPAKPNKPRNEHTDEEQREHTYALFDSLRATIDYENALSYENQYLDFQAKQRRHTI